MRRATMIAAGFSALAVVLTAAPASAGYGAFAFDETTGKYGYSANQQTQKGADELALKGCDSKECKVVGPVGPKQCGALAIGPKAWGVAEKPTRDAAELAAMETCQKRTSAQCKIRHAECNR